MKNLMVLFLLLSTGVSFGASLRSKQARQLVCDMLIEKLSGDGLKLTVEPRYGDSFELIPDFEAKCLKSTKSFAIAKGSYKYSDKLGKLVGLTVDVAYSVRGSIKFTGEIKLKKNVSYDSKSDDFSIGKWSVASQNLKYTIGNKLVNNIAEAIVVSADSGNDGYKDLKEYTDVKSTLAALNKEIEADNEEARSEYEDGDYGGPCVFSKYGEGGGGEADFGYVAENLISFLQENGQVREVYSSDSSENWSEYCAYDNTIIFLKNGTQIILGYDSTT